MADAVQKRVENLQRLLEETVLVEALDGAVVHLLRIYRGASDSPLGKVSLVAANEVTRGFSAALSEDERAVMNSCRRLMELTVLVTEWRFDPDRMDQWITVDARTRDKVFKFGNITNRLKKYYELDDGQVVREKAEYVHHSQWTHAAPFDQSVPEQRLDQLIEELVGHTNAVMREIGALMCSGLEQLPRIDDVPPGVIPDAWLPAMKWRSDRQSALDAALSVFGARINRSAAVPRNWTFESLLEKQTEP